MRPERCDLNAWCPLNLLGTGRKLNVQKMFKRSLGRLLNVLCTFNLRPVFTNLKLTAEPERVN